MMNADHDEKLSALSDAGGLHADYILRRVVEALERMGLVGERKNALLLYLVMTSRLLPRPVNALVTGPSSGGKSFLVDKVASLFPPGAIHRLTASSELALVYSDADFRHCMVIFGEAAGLRQDGAGAAILRSIAWEGHLVYQTVEKTTEGMKARKIEKPGPTGIVTTSTRNVEPELDTRMLTLSVRDDPSHSRKILRATARRAAGKSYLVDRAPFIALQRFLALSDVRDAVVPFAETLSQLVDTSVVRIRRDFEQLLTLIRTHALLYQCQRERDSSGRVIATLMDYKAIYLLTADLFQATASDGLTPAQRVAVQTVRKLAAPGSNADVVASIKKAVSVAKEGVTVPQVAKTLGIDRSSAYRRLINPLKQGYVVNLEDKKGRQMRLVPGERLPKERQVLPSLEELMGAMEAPGG